MKAVSRLGKKHTNTKMHTNTPHARTHTCTQTHYIQELQASLNSPPGVETGIQWFCASLLRAFRNPQHRIPDKTRHRGIHHTNEHSSHKNTHTHAHERSNAHECTLPYTFTHKATYTRTLPHSRTHTQTFEHTDICTNTYTHTHGHKRTKTTTVFTFFF